MTQQPFSDDGEASRLLQSYTLQSGSSDELLDSNGVIRPVWSPLIRFLSQRPAAQLKQDFHRGDQYLRDAGVFFRHYEEGAASERDWPLSHVPVLIDESEFNQISESLVERADLLEHVVADLYGENTLVRDGHLPADLIGSNPEWLRALVGVKPSSGYYLNFIAFEIGRGPDGKWWVLSDRTDIPAGSGFAIENRVATTRIYSKTHLTANILKLAPFFRMFRDTLYGMRVDPTRRIGILSPGPEDDTYFEHAYIARYLGMLLLEGEDLVTEDGKLMLRTVSGLCPIEVLWRRLDASQADPLELDGTSQIGVPGLLSAVRQGHVTMVNALGSGILQTRAMLAFLPSLQIKLYGSRLKMPNVATWWCGDPKARARVIENPAGMMIGSARSTRLPFDENDGAVRGDSFGSAEALAEHIDGDPTGLTAQEIVSLSTTPALVDGLLVPRPMTLRVFMARTRDGWKAMPGGYARIGKTGDATAVGMQRGGRVADTWIVSKSKVEIETMLPSLGDETPSPKSGMLPSRASENLYWLGRYIERAETVIRLMRAYNIRLAEAADPDAPLLTHVAAHLKSYSVTPEERVPRALYRALTSAVTSASRIRDRFSIDGWIVLNELKESTGAVDPDLAPGDETARFMGVLLRQLAGFSGLVRENMYRFTGWRFLSLGRAVERAANLSSALAYFTAEDAPEGSLDLMIDLGDSAMSHRRLFSVAANRETVVQLLCLDGKNPRSILYQLEEIRGHVQALADAEAATMGPLEKASLKYLTALQLMSADAVDTEALLEIGESVDELSGLVSDTYLR